MHIALLDVDLPIPSFYAKHGLYSSRFRSLLQSAASRLDPSIQITTSSYDVVGGCLPPYHHLWDPTNLCKENPKENPITAILITGSASSSYEDKPWIHALSSFIIHVHENYPHVKLFGSCFGHQIIAQSLLKQTHKVEFCPAGYEVGIVPFALNKAFVEDFPMLDEKNLPTGLFRIQFVHGDRVVPISGTGRGMDKADANADGADDGAIAAPWINIGGTAKCPIQGIYLRDRVLTFQGHFEFDVTANRNLVRAFGSRYGWPQEVTEAHVGDVERGRGIQEDEDADDSKAAAEAVVLFFSGSLD